MKYEIYGGRRLYGTLPVYGAKNSVLVLLAGSLLCGNKVVLSDCKNMADVRHMIAILNRLGVPTEWNDDLTIYPEAVNSSDIPPEYAGKLRGSLFLMGALLGRLKRATMPLPGGCAIGKRPIDIHLDGLRALGVLTEERNGVVYCDGRHMHGGKVVLRFPSVGATENLLMCACGIEGETVLENCAVEPEVVALENFLSQAGAEISGIGTSELTVVGGKRLAGIAFCPIPDRIVAATYLLAAAGCGGQLTVTHCIPRHIEPLPTMLQQAGCRLKKTSDSVEILSDGNLRGFGRVSTAPYPAFATDMQSLLLSAACAASGQTVIEENLFENRLRHNARQLTKMHGNVVVDKNVATISGAPLFGAEVEAADLRGGAGLVLAGLFARGKTTVGGVLHIERGYFDLAGQLSSVGADIRTI